jgi:hypothetical protein
MILVDMNDLYPVRGWMAVSDMLVLLNYARFFPEY